MKDPPLPSSVAPENMGALGFCNDVAAVTACTLEPEDGEGVLSDECFAAVLVYGAAVRACDWAEFAPTKDSVSAGCKQGLLCIGKPAYNHNSLTPEAKLAIVDIMHSSDSALRVPDAFGDVFAQAYSSADARVFLLAFSCQDFLWWNRMKDGDYSPEFALAGDLPLISDPSICNRYTSEARDIDEYVHHHPDLVVVVAAGDGQDLNAGSVSAPGTCKNCLAVGSTQSWAGQLKQDSRHLAEVCRDSDCPQVSSAVARAGSLAHTSSCALPAMHPPSTLPECCHAKYADWNYSSDTLHWTSARGYGVSRQASPELQGTPANMYADTTSVLAKRIKPDLVAPGLSVISAKGSGAGTQFSASATCRSHLIAASGSSTSAALVASAAALVRQYFRAGFSPGGFRGSSTPWEPSSALVRAVLLSSGQHVATEMRAEDGSSHPLPQALPNPAVGFGLVHLVK